MANNNGCMNKDFYIEYIQKDLLGSLRPEERKRLTEWRNESIENNQLADHLYKAWEQSDQFGEHIQVDLDSEFQTLMAKRMGAEKKVVRLPYRWLAVAATIVVLVAALSTFRGDNTVVVLAKTDKFEHMLSDGSKVIMAEGSQLTYSKNWDTQRLIHIDGSALFEVVHDDDRAFKVRSEHIQTTVLGTVFLFTDGKKATTPEVQLLEGKVVVLDIASGNTEELEKGQRVVKNEAGTLTKWNQLKTNEFEWYYDSLNFDGADLQSVIIRLQEHYGLFIRLSKELANCKFSGNLAGLNSDEIILAVAEVYGSEVVREGDDYFIAKGKCK